MNDHAMMRMTSGLKWVWNLALPLAILGSAGAAEEKGTRPVDAIQDNSFLVEEAYNQEPGVVQHIFTALYGLDRMGESDKHALDMAFTQEWPVFSQDHQFSYTVPYSFAWNGSHSADGMNDMMLNYRYQAYFDEKSLMAFAPRFSLILPTGENSKGFGNDTVGYQWNLPFSTAIGDRWFIHANAGLTYLPEVGRGPARDLLNYNLGLSAIYCVNNQFNLMLEWVGYWNESVSDAARIERQFASVISPGMRYAFNFKDDSQMVLGLGVPVGLNRAAPDIGAIVYVSFEHHMPCLEKKEK